MTTAVKRHPSGRRGAHVLRTASACDDQRVETDIQRLRIRHQSRVRLVVMAVVGVVAALATGIGGNWAQAAVVGWAFACIVYIVWVWLAVGRMDAAQTSVTATREDPARGVSDLLVVLASAGSLVAVGFVLVNARQAHGGAEATQAGLAVVSVVLSWFLVHTLFTLRYASLYYADDDGGIDFNQKEPPRYLDFAYLAFTLGMTYQVSDTNLQSSRIRATALRHGLLSYVFGSVVLATTINLVVGLVA
jgi:uncharacterized membrane protein